MAAELFQEGINLKGDDCEHYINLPNKHNFCLKKTVFNMAV